MIRIGVIGALSEQLARFNATKLRTSISWTPLLQQNVDQHQQDLIISLKNDSTANHDLLRLTEQDAALVSIISTWPSLPSLSDLDQSVQNSLSEVYGFVVGYSSAMHEV